jgi:hypothetical protein
MFTGSILDGSTPFPLPTCSEGWHFPTDISPAPHFLHWDHITTYDKVTD